MRLTMLGLPGAGKGTQGALLAARYNIPHISTGSMFRRAMEAGTPMGRLAQTYIDKGHLVPDDVAIAIVKERLAAEDCQRGYILDGFPRTVPQAKVLDEALEETAQRLDAAINIRISDKEAIQRISQRLVCSICGATYYRRYVEERGIEVCEVCAGPLVKRADDNEETARERLAVYLEQTHPVLAYYAEQGRLITVNGEQEIDAVHADLLKELVQLKAGHGSSGVR